MIDLTKENVGGKSYTIRVSEKDKGGRLDQFVAGTDLQLSRSQAKTLIEKHLILLNQKPTKPSTHLKAGDVICGTLPEPELLALNPEPLPLTILYEDPSIRFDQNRGFAGIGYRVLPPVLIEIGYMNQYMNKSTIDNMNHILSLNLFLDFCGAGGQPGSLPAGRESSIP